MRKKHQRPPGWQERLKERHRVHISVSDGGLATVSGVRPLASEAVQQALMRKAQAGDEEARNELMMMHLRLVIWLVKRYHYTGGGPQTMDLFQAGVLGLIHGIKRYDFDRGAKVVTALAWSIRGAIHDEAQRNQTTIRVPHCIHNDVLQEKAERAKHSISIEECLDAGTGDSLVCDLGWEAELDDREEFNIMYQRAQLLLAKLPDRSQVIVRQRMEGKTLKEIAKGFGITRERVRQVFDRAISDLREMAEMKEAG